MSYQTLFLDADNTLFDFDRAEREALRRALDTVGLDFSDHHTEVYHRVNSACWRAYEAGKLTKQALRTRRFELFFEETGVIHPAREFADTYLRHLGLMGYLINGTMDVLTQLASDYRLVLVTNGLKEVQHPRLDNAGLRPFFEAVVISDEIGHSKPNAAFFDYAMNCLEGLTREEVLMVGDNFNADIRGGHQYGLDTCWYNPGGDARPEGNISPTYEIRKLEELLPLLVH